MYYVQMQLVLVRALKWAIGRMLCTYYIAPKLKLIVMVLLWVDKTEMATVVIFYYVFVYLSTICLPRYIVSLDLILFINITMGPVLFEIRFIF